MGKQTEQHRRTFALREDLSDALAEVIAADARVAPIDEVEDFYRDLAEFLIERGWVDDYPDGEQ